MIQTTRQEKYLVEEIKPTFYPDFPYLSVLLKLAGFDVTERSMVQFYGEGCYYAGVTKANKLHGKLLQERMLAMKSVYDHDCFLILIACEYHISDYLVGGWKEI